MSAKVEGHIRKLAVGDFQRVKFASGGVSGLGGGLPGRLGADPRPRAAAVPGKNRQKRLRRWAKANGFSAETRPLPATDKDGEPIPVSKQEPVGIAVRFASI